MQQYRIRPLNPSTDDLLPLPQPAWADDIVARGLAPPQPEPEEAKPVAAEAKGKPGQVSVEKTAGSRKYDPGSQSRSVSTSKSYDYRGFDEHIAKQDALANARDAKKAAMYGGDVMSAMLAGNKVRELVGHLRQDAPNTTEDNPYQFKTPLTRLSSESASTSRSGGPPSNAYEGPTSKISVPQGGAAAAQEGDKGPGGDPPAQPPAQPAVVNEQQEAEQLFPLPPGVGGDNNINPDPAAQASRRPRTYTDRLKETMFA